MGKRKLISEAKKDELKKEALRYRTRTEFQINEPEIYAEVLASGYLNDICSHMPIRYNKIDEHTEVLSYIRFVLSSQSLLDKETIDDLIQMEKDTLDTIDYYILDDERQRMDIRRKKIQKLKTKL